MCMWVQVSLCVYMGTRARHRCFPPLLFSLTPYCLDRGFLTKLEASPFSWTASSWKLPETSPQCWGYRHIQPCLALLCRFWGFRSGLGSSYLKSKCLTHWDISPTLCIELLRSKISKSNVTKPYMVVHDCNPSRWETEAGRALLVWGQWVPAYATWWASGQPAL